jgi:prepilin-type N-terminal cleavage/methylation domain-containing protein
MRTAQSTKRRGFTLIETVVTVTIVAALAAVVYPVVIKQIDSADPARVAEDLNNIRTGIETFNLNVRPQQPEDIEDLVNELNASDDNAFGADYTLPVDSSNWVGPYVTLSVPDATAGNAQVNSSGFGVTMQNTLPLFDIDDTDPVGGDSIANRANTTQQLAADFVAVVIINISGAAFTAINELIDGPAENSVTLRRNSGRFRCPYPSASAPTADTDACTAAYYLASPVRHP